MGGKGAEVTVMVLKVDLKCEKCYKKVKKVLCKFPQIRDQVFDEKQGTVIITVVCCSPEKIRDKICCKGGGSIKSIEIKEPKKSPPEEKKKNEKENEKPEEAGKGKKVTFAEPEKDKGKETKKPEAEKTKEKGHEKEKQKDAGKTNPAPADAKPTPVPVAVQGYPPIMYPPPASACCRQCYEGVPGGPCYHMFGGQAHFIQYDGYCGRPVYDSWSGGHNYNRSCYEENPNACSVM